MINQFDKQVNHVDKQYTLLVKDIITNGYYDGEENVRTKWADGTPAHTYSLNSKVLHFPDGMLPLLTTKKVAWKTAIKELLWIWQQKSNVVQDLRDVGVNIWNEWELPDGTIGKAYGYQLGKKNREIPIYTNAKILYTKENASAYLEEPPIGFRMVDQVDYLLYQLKNNPSSRRHITTLWNPDELDEMSLTPCVYETQWYVKNKRLSLDVRCRSNDMGLGNPFNIFQYHVLLRMFAQVLDYEVGDFNYYIGDAHVYDRHVEPLLEQINRYSYTSPILDINPEIKNFYEFTIDDFELINYLHGETINLEVAE